MYLAVITASLVVSYFVLNLLFSFFFTGRAPRFGLRKSFESLLIIIALSLIGYYVVLHTGDRELGNRILHAFGGGFMAFLVCFLVTKDSKLDITRFQFFVFSALVVTGLGVTNEILEYFLQNYGGMVFLRTTNDTWLDLMSNVVGILAAGIVFVPFVGGKKQKLEL